MKSPRFFSIRSGRARHAEHAAFRSVIYSDEQARQHLARRSLFSVITFLPCVLWCGHLFLMIQTLGAASPPPDAVLREIADESLPHALLVGVQAAVITVAALYYVRRVLFRDSYALRPMSANDYENVMIVADVCPPVQAWVIATRDRAADYRKSNLSDIYDFYRAWSGASDLSPEETERIRLAVDPEYRARIRAIQRIQSR